MTHWMFMYPGGSKRPDVELVARIFNQDDDGTLNTGPLIRLEQHQGVTVAGRDFTLRLAGREYECMLCSVTIHRGWLHAVRRKAHVCTRCVAADITNRYLIDRAQR